MLETGIQKLLLLKSNDSTLGPRTVWKPRTSDLLLSTSFSLAEDTEMSHCPKHLYWNHLRSCNSGTLQGRQPPHSPEMIARPHPLWSRSDHLLGTRLTPSKITVWGTSLEHLTQPDLSMINQTTSWTGMLNYTSIFIVPQFFLSLNKAQVSAPKIDMGSLDPFICSSSQLPISSICVLGAVAKLSLLGLLGLRLYPKTST